MSLANTPISVLDLAKVPENGTIAQTFANCCEVAQTLEALNYKRVWYAEHHNIQGIASAATSVLIGHIAGQTKKIRVGSGGIMLPNHSPLVIAEHFGTLASLYPDRIDLGLGRAPGTDQHTMQALGYRQNVDFGDLIEELLYYFKAAEPGQKLKAIPGAGIDVPLYTLGSSLYSARLAASLGRPYAFAGHFAPHHMEQAFALYRKEFQASSELEIPYVMVGLPVIAAQTDEDAEYLATSLKQAFLGLIRGDRRLNKPPVASMDELWNEREKSTVNSMLSLLVTGSAPTVRKGLDKLIEHTGADELIITSDPFDHKDRLRSFEVIAEAKNLT